MGNRQTFCRDSSPGPCVIPCKKNVDLMKNSYKGKIITLNRLAVVANFFEPRFNDFQAFFAKFFQNIQDRNVKEQIMCNYSKH